MIKKHPGAPKGGRVHWFLLFLDEEIARRYKLSYAYLYHRYRLTRYRKQTLVDEFIIVRTSLHCWRVVYFNNNTNEILYNSFQHFQEVHQWIKIKYNAVRNSFFQNYGIKEVKKLNEVVNSYFKTKNRNGVEEAEKIILKFLDRVKLMNDADEIKDYILYVSKRVNGQQIIIDGYTLDEIAEVFDKLYL